MTNNPQVEAEARRLLAAHDASALEPENLLLENAEFEALGDLREALAALSPRPASENAAAFIAQQQATNGISPEAAARIATLEAELTKYGNHLGGCRQRIRLGMTCICGWWAARGALGDQTK